MNFQKAWPAGQAFSLAIMWMENDDENGYCAGKLCKNSTAHVRYNLLI
jgi:hypothetical protein